MRARMFPIPVDEFPEVAEVLTGIHRWREVQALLRQAYKG